MKNTQETFKKFRPIGRISRLLEWKILKHTSSISNLRETLTCLAIASFSSLLAPSRLVSLREKKENIIPEKYCNNNSWSAKFRNYKLRDSRTSAKHIGKLNIRESVGLTPKVYAAFLTIKFRALEEQIFQKHSPFYLLANLKKSV